MIVYKEEAYKIMGAAFKVYNGLGHGFLEAVYQEALEIEFQKRGIPYEREKELRIYYDGVELKQTYKADFVCFGKIIVELKAVSALDDAHRSQVYNYLCLTSDVLTNWSTNVRFFNSCNSRDSCSEEKRRDNV